MNINVKNLIETSNEVYKDIDSRGIRVSIENIKLGINILSKELSIIFDRWKVSSTKELKKKASDLASTIINWPLDSRGNPRLAGDICNANGNPLLVDYVRANSVARRITSLKTLQSNAEGGSLFAPVSGTRLFPEHRVKDDLGRVYVAGFNYTNLPRENRNIVIADKDGDQIWSLDVSSAELVALATLSNDEVLKEDLRSGDFHTAFASRLFNKSPEEVQPEERKRAKTVTFAILYGATEKYLCAELNICEREALELIASFSRQYVMAGKFIQKTYDSTMDSGISETYFGTKRVFKAADDTGKSGVSHAIQSTAGEVVRTQLKRVSDWAKSKNGVVWGVQFDSYLLSLPSSVTENEVIAFTSEVENEFKKIGFEFKLKVELCGSEWK